MIRFKIALLTLTLFTQLVQATDQGANATPPCDESAALEALDKVTSEYREKVRIPSNPLSMMSDFYRTPIRKYYQAAALCPTRTVVKKYIAELQYIGFPNEYIPSILTGLGKSHGLKVYELGDTWNREIITEDLIAQDLQVKNLYQNIAIMGLPKAQEGLVLYSAGTGFRLGQDETSVYVGTALHVLSENAEKIALLEACQKFVFHFPSLGKRSFKGKQLIHSNSATDFAICQVEMSKEELALFQGAPLAPSTQELLTEDTPLITAGYNSHNPTPHKAHVERSADCRLFMPSSQAKTLNDFKGSFGLPTACDVAPGDSGSPVLDRSSGQLLGIMTNTTQVKSGQSSEELTSTQKNPHLRQALWSELSMLSPITKIREINCPDASDLVRRLLRCQ